MTHAALPPAELQRALRNAGALGVAGLITRGALFLWQLLLARLLDQVGYGIYGTLGGFLSIGAAFAMFGTGAIIVREVARAPARSREWLGAALLLRSGLALLAWLLLNGFAALAGYEAHLRELLALAALSLLVDGWGNSCHDVLIARERMLATSLVSLAHVALLLVLGALALGAGHGLAGLYLATIVASLGRALLLLGILLRAGLAPCRVGAGQLRALLRESAPLGMVSLLGLAWSASDRLMAGRILGATPVAWLTGAYVITWGLNDLLGTAILTAVFPLMSRSGADRSRLLVEKLTWLMLALGLPVALLLGLFAPEITLPLFGAAYRPTADLLRALGWFVAMRLLASIFTQALIVAGRQRSLTVVRAAGLGTNIALNALLLPRVGIGGAAIASLLGELLTLAILARLTRPRAAQILPRVLPLLALALLTGLLMAALGSWQPWLAMPLGMALYAVGIARMLQPDERALLLRMLPARMRPRLQEDI